MRRSPSLLLAAHDASVLRPFQLHQMSVFPVAVCLLNFPLFYDVNEAYSFAKAFGKVERVIPLQRVPLEAELGEEPLPSFRVQFVERSTVLLVIRSRGQLVVEGQAIGVKPLFLWDVCEQTVDHQEGNGASVPDSACFWKTWIPVNS